MVFAFVRLGLANVNEYELRRTAPIIAPSSGSLYALLNPLCFVLALRLEQRSLMVGPSPVR